MDQEPADRPALQGYRAHQARQARPTTTAAEKVRFAMAVVAVLVVLAAVFGIVRVMQQNNADRNYEACLEQARQQAESSEVTPGPTVPDPQDMCQRPN